MVVHNHSSNNEMDPGDIISRYLHNVHCVLQGGCKHEISMSKGELASPHYPDYYPAKKVEIITFNQRLMFPN